MAQVVRAFAPATVANVACGFDVLGFAVERPGDEVEITLDENLEGVEIELIDGDEGELPLDPMQNTVSRVIIEYMKVVGRKDGVRIKLFKQMPLKSGLGSSAASSVVGVYAVNHLLGKPLPDEALLRFAIAGEELACGSAHADNVAPALLGGFVLVRSYAPLDVVRLPTPEKLHCTLIHPHIEVKTKDARSILRKEIPMHSAVQQWGNLGGLIAGLYREDYELIGRSLQDVIVEPVRSLLIPGFDRAKKAALDAGALGCSISGSGPSLFALSTSEADAERIGTAMRQSFTDLGIGTDQYVSKVSPTGPRILS